MKLKSKIILPVLAIIVLGGVGIFGIERVFAQSAPGYNPSIIQKLAQKFGLKEDDVKAVFDQNRQERQVQMQTRFEQTLDQFVKDGKISDTQRQAILEKRQELKDKLAADRENWKNMTPDQRKALIKQQKLDLDNWAKQNDIDLQYFYGGFKGHLGGMRGGWHMR